MLPGWTSWFGLPRRGPSVATVVPPSACRRGPQPGTVGTGCRSGASPGQQSCGQGGQRGRRVLGGWAPAVAGAPGAGGGWPAESVPFFAPAWAAATVRSLRPSERQKLLSIVRLAVSLRVAGAPARARVRGPRECPLPPPPRLPATEQWGERVLWSGGPQTAGGGGSPFRTAGWRSCPPGRWYPPPLCARCQSPQAWVSGLPVGAACSSPLAQRCPAVHGGRGPLLLRSARGHTCGRHYRRLRFCEG